MTVTDKTYCVSANCTNKCGRKMTKKEKMHIRDLAIKGVDILPRLCVAYLCDKPDKEIK